MKKQLDEKQLEKFVGIVKKLLLTIPGERGDQIREMMEGPIGTEYFLCPASTRTEFHSCYPGGLMAHSLNVVKNLYALADALCPGKFERSTLNLVGLFHDFGKVGDGKNPFYKVQESSWHREKLGQLYEVNKECLNMPNSERGLFIFQEHGIQLSSDEYLAIRLNDGMYAAENKPYSMNEPELALLLHWADRWSCEQEKQEQINEESV